MEPRSTDTHLMQTVTDSFVCPDEKVICFIQNQPGRFICSPVNTDNRHLPVTISLISSNLLGSCFIPKGRQGAVCKIKCCNCHATYIGGTGRNLSTWLTEHNEPQVMVTSTITLLNTIHRRNIKSTGSLCDMYYVFHRPLLTIHVWKLVY